MMQQTSLDAYTCLKETKLDAMQQAVLDVMKAWSCNYPAMTDRMIQDAGHFKDSNMVRPRRNELVKLGYVVQDHKAACRVSGKSAIYWRAL